LILRDYQSHGRVHAQRHTSWIARRQPTAGTRQTALERCACDG
jgi:hypothetical protein